MAIQEKPIRQTPSEVAKMLGLSSAVVRRHCQNGTVPEAVWHEYVGTGQGYYTLSESSIAWLRENVKPRNHG